MTSPLRRRLLVQAWPLRRFGISLEWEPRDLWIGAFIKRETRYAVRPALHVYVCPLPTVVLHFMWMGKRPT